MQVKDSEVMRLIDQLGNHYRTNISNRYIRPALLHLPIDNQSWDLIESLTEKSEMYLYQGYHLEELYMQLASAARFVSLARKELAPVLRIRLGGSTFNVSDRVLREMAINNFSSNLKLFADMLNELFVRLAQIDRENSPNRSPLYTRMDELRDFGRLIIG